MGSCWCRVYNSLAPSIEPSEGEIAAGVVCKEIEVKRCKNVHLQRATSQSEKNWRRKNKNASWMVLISALDSYPIEKPFQRELRGNREGILNFALGSWHACKDCNVPTFRCIHNCEVMVKINHAPHNSMLLHSWSISKMPNIPSNFFCKSRKRLLFYTHLETFPIPEIGANCRKKWYMRL